MAVLKVEISFKDPYLSEFENLLSLCEFFCHTGDRNGQVSTTLLSTGSWNSLDCFKCAAKREREIHRLQFVCELF